jgi:hypothetical protein
MWRAAALATRLPQNQFVKRKAALPEGNAASLTVTDRAS